MVGPPAIDSICHAASTGASVTIELVEPPDMPPVIRLRWPQKPSICTSAYSNVAAAAMKILAAAVTELSAIRVRRKL